ncbi:RuBisCO large subunit C-terminal-like domain-containing protein [Hoeflea sp. G2-23]|uniref:RuBisCO large subunit C-terminal-like domain-containing protein n=1 Tax=Hoeflea algicola TaxID=2983763 RepID=A0ABT3Z6R2_9HYPH|nr:RuBisCO large subunit C-terminal-like domain-containing protein [Hoeflea algicola]MCY0147463.1 RuBisCO large subunit C-terminal-like domain-containing protein [Hoeflea algicola]
MAGDNRFRVIYRLLADSAAEADSRARGIALEQTVEIPGDIVPAGYVSDEIVGQVEHIRAVGDNAYEATISYSPDSAGDEVIQLINVIFGNSSIQQNIRVVGIDPGPEIRARFGGPRFGIQGVRARAGRARGGLISPVIKPQGSSVRELAEIAHRCVLGGADIIKDDHGLANQKMAPFAERVKAVSVAVAEANAKCNGKAQYFVNVTGYSGNPVAEAFAAKEAGAGGVLLMPGLMGFGVVHALSRDPSFDLPIMTHPSFTGSYVLTPETGVSHALMYGVFQRLAGSDISVFPNVGGRFGFSVEECLSIAEACRDPGGLGQPIMPSPGGGMSVERAGDMVSMYGEDVVFLLGGSLLRAGDKIGEAVRAMRDAIDRIGS